MRSEVPKLASKRQCRAGMPGNELQAEVLKKSKVWRAEQLEHANLSVSSKSAQQKDMKRRNVSAVLSFDSERKWCPGMVPNRRSTKNFETKQQLPIEDTRTYETERCRQIWQTERYEMVKCAQKYRSWPASGNAGRECRVMNFRPKF